MRNMAFGTTLTVLCGLAICGNAPAESVWINTSGGDWLTAGNWQDSNVPVNGSDVSINADGTYQSTWNYDDQQITVGFIDVGTSTSTGEQTLRVNALGYRSAGVTSNISIGPRGVFIQDASFGDPGSVVNVNIADGGRWQSVSTDSRDWGWGRDRVLDLDSGGTVELEPGGVTMRHDNDVAYIDGTISGSGPIWVSGGGQIQISGAGLIDGPGQFGIPYNGHLWVGGTLTINRDFVPGGSNLGGVRFMDGATNTVNGDMVWTNPLERAFWVTTAAAEATVQGSGDVDIPFKDGTKTRFGGYGGGYNPGGVMNLNGTGQLALRTDGVLVDMFFDEFNLGRSGTVYGDGVGGTFRIEQGRDMNVLGFGGNLTVASNATVLVYKRVTYGAHSYLQTRAGGGLTLDNGHIQGFADGADPYSVNVSADGTGGGLALTAATSNTLMGIDGLHALSVRLGSNASTSAGEGAELALRDASLHVAMTDGADWGWSDAGTLQVGSGVELEALSTDHGASIALAREPFVLNELAVTVDGATLTLAETADNDGEGADTALYVRTLDLSALSGGSIDLDGLAGAERVYYLNLVNPNGVAFVTPAEWVQMVDASSPTIITIR